MAVSITFDRASHSYTLDSRPVPSVTTIISELNLLPNYPAHKREWYQQRGSAIHLATALADQGKLKCADDRIGGFLRAWSGFRHATDFTPLLIEYPVGSRLFQYCGTLDRLGLLAGKLAIVDIKAGEPPDSTALQTSGYARAYTEMTGESVDRRISVRLSEDGSYRSTEYLDHQGDDKLFLYAVSLFHWKSKNL